MPERSKHIRSSLVRIQLTICGREAHGLELVAEHRPQDATCRQCRRYLPDFTAD
jgi:hypothetical protein